MVEYIKLLDESLGFPTKLKLTTPSGDFEMDSSKVTGYDYSLYRKKLFEGEILEAREILKKKMLLLGEKKYEDLMKEDFLTDMIFDKGLSMLIDSHEKSDIESEYFEVLEKNELFGTITRLKITIDKESFVLNRKGIRGIDYQEQKKSLMENTYERTNQNIISRCVEDKDNFKMTTIMTKPFWYYKRLDNGKQALMGDNKPF
jgi:hypothetical protein